MHSEVKRCFQQWTRSTMSVGQRNREEKRNAYRLGRQMCHWQKAVCSLYVAARKTVVDRRLGIAKNHM